MKIYFAGSITGGRELQPVFLQMIEEIKKYGNVLTEHIGNAQLGPAGEVDKTDKEVYERDIAWVKESDALIADVSIHSAGVGYEIGFAEARNIPVLVLWKELPGKRVSRMIKGNSNLVVKQYATLEEAKNQISAFFQQLQKQ